MRVLSVSSKAKEQAGGVGCYQIQIKIVEEMARGGTHSGARRGELADMWLVQTRWVGSIW